MRNDSTHHRNFLARLAHLPFVVLEMLYAYLCYATFWVSDDAFISFRYAKHLARGDGLRFNVGESPPVEGFTNFLWVILASLCEFLVLPPALVMSLLSSLCGMCILWRLYRIGLHHFRLLPLHAAFALVPMAVMPPFIVWSTSGLETMAFALFLLLVFEGLFLEPRANLWWVGSAGALLCLTRGEGPAWAICLGALALLLGPRRKELCPYFLLIAATTLSYLLFRVSYFESWLPNTAHAKVQSGIEVWDRGARYVVSFLLSFVTPALLLLLTPIACMGGHTQLILRATIVVVGFYLFAILVGGDFMSAGRFLVPTLPLQAIVLAAALDTFRKGGNIGRAVAWIVPPCLAAISALPWADIMVVPKSVRAAFHFRWDRSGYIDELAFWRFMQKNTRHWQLKAKAIGAVTERGESMVVGPIGNMGYFTELFLYDCYGLTTKLDPRLLKESPLRSPGHDLRVPPKYFLNRNPTYLEGRVTRASRLGELYERRGRYPERYGPVLRPAPRTLFPGGETFVVLIKRFDTPTEAAARWEALAPQRTEHDPYARGGGDIAVDAETPTAEKKKAAKRRSSSQQ
ncbi:MAG: hypothetical protein QY326_00335 [Bdellovibrionota bacterium]|nr:MAG: hypothetical protein QY326_00335 [Bdellovibrionota bacterium]